MENQSRSMILDTIVYMIAKIIEGLVGIITVSAYTYCFIPSEYGKYNIVNLTVVTSALVIINWLAQAIMRYINEYDDLVNFYSTVFFLWLKLTIAVIIICSISIIIYSVMFLSLNFILWLSLIMFITYGANMLTSNILVVKRKIKLNLVLSLGSIFAKLFMTLGLIKLFGARIEWILIPNILFDLISVLIVVFKLDIIKYIAYSKYSKAIVNKLLIFGIPIIGLNFSTSILYNSDRYIIQILIDSTAVGIYYANYSLMSSAFSMISNAIMKGSYPSILKAWTCGDKTQALNLISQAVRHYLLICVPSIIGIAVLAESISTLILEPQYVEGYVVMKWVALGMTFLGLTEYSNKYWELEVNTKVILKLSFISGLINILLNLSLIPLLGYKIAAITTSIGFFIYFVLSMKGSQKHFKWNLNKLTYIRIIISGVLMGICLKFIIINFKLSLITIFISIIIGILIYLLCLYFMGEIKEEMKLVKKLLKTNKI